MTKNIQTLCDLFNKTKINYEVIADNEISVEALALGLEHQNPQFATEADLDKGIWQGESYIHICEAPLGMFSISVVNEVCYD